MPDIHCFCGRGTKDTLPLYRDAQAQHPNLHPALPAALKQAFEKMVGAEDIAAYPTHH